MLSGKRHNVVQPSLRRFRSKTQNRLAVWVLFGFFLVAWLVSLDQYIFIPSLGAAAYAAARSRRGLPLSALLGVPLVAMTALAAAAMVFSNFPGNAARTAAVWGGALVLLVFVARGGSATSSIVIRVLLRVWLASMVVYAVSLFAPAVTDALIGAKVQTGLASSTDLSTPSLFYEYEVERPIGFALYANELALFGLVIVPLYVWHEKCNSRMIQLALTLTLLTNVILSTSRSILLTGACMTIVALALRPTARGKRKREGVVLTLVGAAILIAVITLLQPGIYADITASLDEVADARVGGSADLRALSYQEGFRIFGENVLTGVGGLPQLENIQAGSHNLPLSAAVRHGIFGLALVLMLLVYGTITGLKLIISRSMPLALCGSALLSAMVSSVTIQFDDDVLTFSAILLAMVLAVSRRNYLVQDNGKESTRKLGRHFDAHSANRLRFHGKSREYMDDAATASNIGIRNVR